MKNHKELKVGDVIPVTNKVIRRENGRNIILGFHENIPCFPMLSIKKIYKGFNTPKDCKVTKILTRGIVVIPINQGD